MRSSFLVSLLALSLSLLSLPSLSFGLNGTMRLSPVTLSAPFLIRQEAGVSVYPKPFTFRTVNGDTQTWSAGFIVLFGGEAQVLPVAERSLNDVWLTSDGGSTWVLVSGSNQGVTATASRNIVDGARSCDCSDADGGLYLVGGSTRSPTIHSSNVSYSADVVNWDFFPNQGFFRRQRSTCAVNRAKELFVLGGLTHVNNAATATSSNDVWMTRNVGGNGGWTPATTSARWAARQGLNAEFYYSAYLGTEVLYAMNGYVGAPRWNDIWISTTNGMQWVRLNPYADYDGRMDAQLTITAAGIMVVSSGDCGDTCNKNDVWASLDGGYSWGNCCDGDSCGFTKREDHVQAIDSQGRLVIISGSQQNPPGPDTNDVWRSNTGPNFNDPAAVARSCNLKVPTVGVGLRCIPGGFCPQHPLGNAMGQGVKMNLVTYAPWAPRFEGGVSIFPKALVFTDVDGVRRTLQAGALVTWGGRPSYGNIAYNDVWATSNGNSWYLIGGYDAASGTPSRNTARVLIDQARTADCSDSSSGKIYILGGTAPGNVRSSAVWTSTDAGMNWVKVGDAPWTGREAATCMVDSKGVLVVMAGTTAGENTNDVWSSANGGATWTRRSMAAPWERRTQADGESYRSEALGVDVLYVANGIGVKPASYNRINDVWVSSNSGSTWAAVTLAAPYYGRQDSQLLVTATGALLVVAGDTGLNDPGNTNDIWASLDGGYTWGLCNNTAGFEVREDHVAVLDSGGFLWVMQGEAPNTEWANGANDVWKSQTAFTDSTIVSLCKLRTPTCGVGLRCWPNNKACVNHCPPYDPDEPVDPVDPNQPTTTTTSDSSLSAGYIILIIAIILAVLAAAYWVWKKRTESKSGALLGGDLSTGLTSGSDLLGQQTASDQYQQLEHGSHVQQL